MNLLWNKATDEVPQLPPKNLEKTDESLNARMKQLEEYLNFYFLQNPINPNILEFLEVTNSGSQIFQELSKLKISSIDWIIGKWSYLLTESKKVEAVFESDMKIYPHEEFVPIFLTFTFTYEQIKEFNDDLKRISWLGDIDIRDLGELPSDINPNGIKVLDKDLMIQLQEYINRLKNNSSILNMILFKKFISDNYKENINDQDAEFINEDKKGKLNLMSSIRGKSDLFKIRDVSPHGSDSDDQLF